MKISILGGGSWGSALAIHLAHNGHSVKVWEFFKEQAEEMQQKRICKLLPHEKLQDNIFVSHDMSKVLKNTEVVFIAVPSEKVSNTIASAAKNLGSQPIIICSKGFGEGTKLLSAIVKEKIKGEVYCLYGPTHAEEVCKKVFSGVILAGKGRWKARLHKVIESSCLKVELSQDIIGVQVAAALKNILAVFVGVLDGAHLGDNTKAYVMTKGLEEIKIVGLKMGAKENTFYGLAGLGDVIVTCTSKHSRNHYVGEEVGKGRKLNEVLKEMNMVAEGITALKHLDVLKKRYALKLPVMSALQEVLFKEKDVKEVLNHFK